MWNLEIRLLMVTTFIGLFRGKWGYVSHRRDFRGISAIRSGAKYVFYGKGRRVYFAPAWVEGCCLFIERYRRVPVRLIQYPEARSYE